MTIKKRDELMKKADENPDAKGKFFLCLGDLETIGLPLCLFGFQKEDFVTVEGQQADKLDFCRQGLEPVVSFDCTLAQAFVFTTKLPKFRWAMAV